MASFYVLHVGLIILFMDVTKAETKLSDLRCSINDFKNITWKLISLDPVNFADQANDDVQLMIKNKDKYLCANINNNNKLSIRSNRIAKILNGCKWSLKRQANLTYLINNVKFQIPATNSNFDYQFHFNQIEKYITNKNKFRSRSKRFVRFWYSLLKPASHDGEEDSVLECFDKKFIQIYIKFRIT
jgi:hypothetical protein